MLVALAGLASMAQARQPAPVATTAPTAAGIAPLDADEWNRFVVAIDALRGCVERSRDRRTPAQAVATLQALGLAGEMRAQALLLLPAQAPSRAALAAAADDAQAIMRSFQAISGWEPTRPIEQARALAYVYHFEAQATAGACLPSADFLSNYHKALS
ncbi:hypothetical protein CO641_09170 [Lysobacteraceae bacterium NML91-0213]|nr:hypothetical protein CO641_09170 [Xanthomonadaceae bacterium NML91-0213]